MPRDDYTKTRYLNELKDAMINFVKAWYELEEVFSNIYYDCNEYIVDKYPFHLSFDEIDVYDWRDSVIELIEKEMKL